VDFIVSQVLIQVNKIFKRSGLPLRQPAFRGTTFNQLWCPHMKPIKAAELTRVRYLRPPHTTRDPLPTLCK